MRLRWVLVLVLAAVVAATVVVSSDDDTEQERAQPDERPTTTLAPPSGPEPGEPAFDREVDELQRFVERTRGLEFKREVVVELLSQQELQRRLQSDVNAQRDEIKAAEAVFHALGLVPPDVDLLAALTDLVGAGVVGFYDPESEQLVVLASELTPFARETLVHELTHALDDQHFRLDRPELEQLDDDAGLAYRAAVEGSAEFVRRAYTQTMTRQERRASFREKARTAGGGGVGDAPPALVELMLFPYGRGLAFTEAVEDERGRTAVDGSLGPRPPASSEHILHPEAYLGGERPVGIDAPAAGGPVVDQGMLGEFLVRSTLAQELGSGDARTAADGWGGDRYVAWRTPTGSCVRATIVADTPADLSELTFAFKALAVARPGVQLAPGPGSLTFTACSG